jgi:hypothetical protein
MLTARPRTRKGAVIAAIAWIVMMVVLLGYLVVSAISMLTG